LKLVDFVLDPEPGYLIEMAISLHHSTSDQIFEDQELGAGCRYARPNSGFHIFWRKGASSCD
jgi:hypothetical protein